MVFEMQRARDKLRELVQATLAMEARRRPEQMCHIIQEMNTTADPNSIFPVALRKVVRMFVAERGFLMLGRGPDDLHFQVTAALDGHTIERPEEEVSHSLIREVAATRKPVVVQNSPADTRRREVVSTPTLKALSVMCAPCVVDSELLGLIYLDSRVLPAVFDDDGLTWLSLFAGHAAVAVRNAQLLEELRQARQDLLHAERLKALGQIATSVAHEIRNPLLAMKLMTSEVLERHDDPKFRQAFAEVFEEETSRLNNVIEGILDHARPSQLRTKHLDIRQTLDATVALFQPSIARAGVTIVRHYGATIPVVLADRDKLRQVFCNLLQNAIEAVSTAGTRRITLTVARRGNTHVDVRVRDTGPGIPENIKSRLFVPFVTAKKGGTGLGLAISARIVSEHGGTVEAVSCPGGGAEFCVALPAASE